MYIFFSYTMTVATVGGHLPWWPFFFSLHQDLFHQSFLGNCLARICFLFRMRWKGPDIHTSIFSPSLYPSCFLHSSLYPTRLFPQEKAFVREKWNWVNTSKLCSQESTAMHTKPKEVLGVCLCVRKRERERNGERERRNESSYAYKASLSWHLGQPNAFPGNCTSNSKVIVTTRLLTNIQWK